MDETRDKLVGLHSWFKAEYGAPPETPGKKSRAELRWDKFREKRNSWMRDAMAENDRQLFGLRRDQAVLAYAPKAREEIGAALQRSMEMIASKLVGASEAFLLLEDTWHLPETKIMSVAATMEEQPRCNCLGINGHAMWCNAYPRVAPSAKPATGSR